MGKITFILGGARSGKSSYAQKLAQGKGIKIAFIATGQPLDKEMKKRILIHKNNRPPHWKNFEEPLNPVPLLKNIGEKFDVILIDCLTLMVSNFMLRGIKEAFIKNNINKMAGILKKTKANSIIVSNEVGLGIVPENKLAREFRDIAGRANQIVAEKADEVFFMVSGIPLILKKNKKGGDNDGQ